MESFRNLKLRGKSVEIEVYSALPSYSSSGIRVGAEKPPTALILYFKTGFLSTLQLGSY